MYAYPLTHPYPHSHTAPPSPSHTLPASPTTPATIPSQPHNDHLLLPARIRRPHPSPSHKASLGSLKGQRVLPGTVDAGQCTAETGEDVLGRELGAFVVEEEETEVEGYQLFAVEKWVVERETLLPTVTVWTGDPADKITVAVLRLADSSVPFSSAIHPFRKHGARPMEIKQGTIMVTSLSTFRSDLTLVPLPSGSFPPVRSDLLTNIALSRLGCSGRRALTLEPPTQAAQDKFLQIYHLVPSSPFYISVLTLLKLVQSALLIYGCFPPAPSWRDGLLCDATVEGLQRWMADVGEPVFDLEPSGRVLEAELLSALLSSITGARARLAALCSRRADLRESDVPRDPLAHPAAFLRALAAWQRASRSPVTYLSATVLRALRADQPTSTRPRRLSDPAYPHPPALSRTLRQKFDEALPLAGGHHVPEVETTDLERFARMSVVKGGEGLDSVRWLWTGRARADIARQGDRDVGGGGKEGGHERKETGGDGTGEEDAESFLGGVGGALWRAPGNVGKVGRRGHAIVTGWKKDIMEFGRHRGGEGFRSPPPVPSSALSAHSQSTVSTATPITAGPATAHSLEVPTLVVSTSGGEEDVEYHTKSGRTGALPSPFRSAQSSFSNLSDTLSSAHPSTSRFALPLPLLPSSSGHKSRASLVGGRKARPRIFGSKSDSGLHELEGVGVQEIGRGRRRPEARRAATYYIPAPSKQEERGVGLMKPMARRHSFTCLEEFRDVKRVMVGRLKIDVDLCEALLELREREGELRETAHELETLVASQRDATSVVHAALRARRSQLESLTSRARPLIIDPSIHRRPGDGIEPILSRVQRATDELGRLKYTYEVTDDRLREVENLVWGLMRRAEDRQIREILMEEEKRTRGVGKDGKKVWIKGGQRLRGRLVRAGMWTWSWWDWMRGRGTVRAEVASVGESAGGDGMTSGMATPARTPSEEEARTPPLLRTRGIS